MAGDAGRTDGRPELSRQRLFLAIAATYGLALLVWLLWPAFRESLIGKFVAIPVFSIYLFEHLGIPGLTERGSCDWMWCKPADPRRSPQPTQSAMKTLMSRPVAWRVPQKTSWRPSRENIGNDANDSPHVTRSSPEPSTLIR